MIFGAGGGFLGRGARGGAAEARKQANAAQNGGVQGKNEIFFLLMDNGLRHIGCEFHKLGWKAGKGVGKRVEGWLRKVIWAVCQSVWGRQGEVIPKLFTMPCEQVFVGFWRVFRGRSGCTAKTRTCGGRGGGWPLFFEGNRGRAIGTDCHRGTRRRRWQRRDRRRPPLRPARAENARPRRRFSPLLFFSPVCCPRNESLP